MNPSTVDRKTLAWIKEGVDETLQFAQAALSEFTENMDDTTPIKICISALHRVSGAATMVEIEGAALLATEMKLLACALVEGQVKARLDAAEVLAAGMFQLTGYLDSLYHGQPDLPLVLLPLLNDCRACQNKELFTEGDFFSPNLAIAMPAAHAACLATAHRPGLQTGNSISALARKLRPGYLSGLLGILRKENEADNLKKLTFVLNKLLGASTTEKSEQLWWIALGMVDTLHAQQQNPSVSVKILLARIDSLIKQVITSGEQILTQQPPIKIIKNLLYYIARSPVDAPRIGDIKQAFQLSCPTTDACIETARETLYGFNVNMIDSVTSQLTEELATIRDALDISLHRHGGATEGLEPILKNFSVIKETLGMLGMKKQQAILAQQEEFLRPRISQGEILSDEELMGIATALLHIESSIHNLAGEMRQPTHEDTLSPAEYENLLKVVARELLAVIKEIKDAVNEYSITPSRIELLGKVPDQLKQIADVMCAINDEQQSNLAHAINQYACQELILNQSADNMFKLDLFADAITGLENYYQAILEESVSSEVGLAVAARSITELGYPPAPSITAAGAMQHATHSPYPSSTAYA
ncbi:MAG: hypothetical protein RRB22_04480 [Gammaproteobacteria bacterium]|nr:hypothetical protein [Gammaproteobacteria bacterium]